MTKQWFQKTAAICVAGMICLTASTAWGEWGEGVRGGPFVVHPGASLSVGFDSNVYYASQDEPQTLRQAPEGVLEPRLTIETADPDRIDLSADAAVGWRQYFTDDDAVQNQSGLSASADVYSRFNPEGTLSLELSNEFTRTNESPNSAVSRTSNRIFNRSGAMVGLHPGAGLLETYGSYDFSIYRHNLYSDLDRHTHHFGWDGHWSFLPKTSVTGEVDVRMIRYEQGFRGQNLSPEGRLQNVDSNPVRALGGVEGLITPRITLGLRGGYGWARYEDGPDHSGILARVEASYQFGDVELDNRLRAGYKREFSDSSIGNFYTSHRGIAGYEQGFADNRLRLELQVDAEIRDYSDTGVDSAQSDEFQYEFPDELADMLVGVEAGTRFEIRNGWDIAANYNFRSNFTDDEIVVLGPGEDVIRDYQRHHVLLSTEIRY